MAGTATSSRFTPAPSPSSRAANRAVATIAHRVAAVAGAGAAGRSLLAALGFLGGAQGWCGTWP
ncbi:hypothetical protein GCM10019017_73210 [Streptomyces showdoensis]